MVYEKIQNKGHITSIKVPIWDIGHIIDVYVVIGYINLVHVTQIKLIRVI